MGLIIAFLTVVLVLSSVFLIFLILLQLPKKEAGAGMAFGGSTADTLFGAGSGNVLTKLTKYTTGLFLGLSLVLAVMHNHHARGNSSAIGEKLKTKESPAALPVAPLPGLVKPQGENPSTNALMTTPAPAPATPPVNIFGTNAPSAPTNPPAK